MLASESDNEIIINQTIEENKEENNNNLINNCPLPGREPEISQIKEIILDSIKNNKSKAMYISGETGTGKTAVIKQILYELEHSNNYLTNNNNNTVSTISADMAIASDNEANNNKAIISPNSIQSLFINAMKINQPFKAFEIIYENIVKPTYPRLKQNKKPNKSQYKTRIENYFKNEKSFHKRKFCILILDEMDFLINHKTNHNNKTNSLQNITTVATQNNINLLYDLIDITRDKFSKLFIIGISNTVSLLDNLHSKIKSRFDEILTFKPYENSQLLKIIENKIGNENFRFEKQAIKLIALTISRKTGDLRRAMDIIKRCLEISSVSTTVTSMNSSSVTLSTGMLSSGINSEEIKEENEKQIITVSFVRNILNDFIEIYPISNLSIYHKIFIFCLIKEFNNLNNQNYTTQTTTQNLLHNDILFEKVLVRCSNFFITKLNSKLNSNNTLQNNNLNNNNLIKFIPNSIQHFEYLLNPLIDLDIISIKYDNKERLPIISLEMMK
ncbi:hypothetical protein ABK040_006159 [Willaertia magna]